jgi:hypothetical protein
MIAFVEGVVSVKPVVVPLLRPVPDIVIPSMESKIGVICGLLCPYRKPRTICEDVSDVSFSQSL